MADFARLSMTDSHTMLDMGALVEVRPRGAVGGGRGVFAKRDIVAGEVVLDEMPLLATLRRRMQNEEPVYIQLARRILQNSDRQKLLANMEPLYPQNLKELTPEVLEKAQSKHGGAVSYLCDVQAPPKLSEDEVLCILLKVCFSAFTGGLYVKKAMLNHCCRPNCMVFQPGERMCSSGKVISATASEVVATRPIAKDEEITICYFVPMERSHASRARLFEDQHLCPLGPSPWPAEMEALLGESDPSFDRAAAAARLEALEAALDALDEELDGGDVTPAAALARLDGELVPAAAALLPPAHLVRCRINSMVARCCHAIAAEPADGGGGGRRRGGKAAGGDGGGGASAGDAAVLRMLRACLELRAALTDAVMGSAHCEVARVLCDTHVALDYLLARADALLYTSFPGQLDTWQKASKAEYAARREYLRIAKLYDPPPPPKP